MAAHPTVGAVLPRVQYAADGYQTDFPYDFPILKSADLRIYLNDIRHSTGVSVSGAGTSGGGQVVFAVPPPAGTTVTLLRKVTIQRLSDFQEGGAFRAKVINDELDVQVMALQELEGNLDRAVTLSPTVSGPVSLFLPPVVPGKAIGWADDGSGLVNDPTDFTSTVQIVQTWAADAEGSVQTALNAAAAAAASAAGTAAMETAASAAASQAVAAAGSADGAAVIALTSASDAAKGAQSAEAFAMDSAFAAFVLAGDRAAVVASATVAQAAATAAGDRAMAALGRLEDSDLSLWRSALSARRAGDAADRAAASARSASIAVGIDPGAMLPNWARIST